MIPEISELLKDSCTNFFATVRPKNFDRKTGYRLLCTKFFDTRKLLKHWSDALENFRHCEIKTFRRKNVISPLSSIKLFETKIFLKNSRVTVWKFLALWDTQILIEKRDMPPLIHKFFSIPGFFLKNRKFPLQSFSFRSCETKKSTKRWKNFDTRILSKRRSVLLRISMSLSENVCSTEFGDIPF